LLERHEWGDVAPPSITTSCKLVRRGPSIDRAATSLAPRRLAPGLEATDARTSLDEAETIDDVLADHSSSA